jgi:hypothetical protein
MVIDGMSNTYEVEKYCEARGWSYVTVPSKCLKDGEAIDRYQIEDEGGE